MGRLGNIYHLEENPPGGPNRYEKHGPGEARVRVTTSPLLRAFASALDAAGLDVSLNDLLGDGVRGVLAMDRAARGAHYIDTNQVATWLRDDQVRAWRELNPRWRTRVAREIAWMRAARAVARLALEVGENPAARAALEELARMLDAWVEG
jgi:hypothetical protein